MKWPMGTVGCVVGAPTSQIWPQGQMSPVERKTLNFQKHPLASKGVSGLAWGNVKGGGGNAGCDQRERP